MTAVLLFILDLDETTRDLINSVGWPDVLSNVTCSCFAFSLLIHHVLEKAEFVELLNSFAQFGSSFELRFGLGSNGLFFLSDFSFGLLCLLELKKLRDLTLFCVQSLAARLVSALLAEALCLGVHCR